MNDEGKLNMDAYREQKEMIARVKRMEQYYDKVLNLLAHSPQVLYEDIDIQKMIEELTEYMYAGLWLQDYECDERGELPADLKRGVLSEDGLYNLLCDIECLFFLK